MILENVLANENLALFGSAKIGYPPDKCPLIKRFGPDEGWPFFDLKTFGETNKGMIKLPFKEDFQKCIHEKPLFL